MVWIRGRLIVLQVTSDAGGVDEVVVVIDMAVGTLTRRHGVSARQRKSNRRVIEIRIEPVVGSVAVVAGYGELGLNVTRIARGLKIRSVTRVTLSRHRLELAIGRTLVARIAVDRGVGSRERKAVIMLLHLLHRDLPSSNRVTLLAVGSQLPPVNIGVAVLAALTYIREHGFNVTLRAGHRLVHAAKWITRLIMVEFRHCASGSPRICCVAVLARNIQITVWTMRLLVSLPLRRSPYCGNNQ